MKRLLMTLMSLILVFGMTGCSKTETNDKEIIGGADGPTSIIVKSGEEEEHFLNYLKGDEADAAGEKFWAVGEPDMEYALYDMNGDGVNELIVRAYGSWIYDIILYKDGKIQSANVENLGSSGVTFVNDKDQFVSGDTGHEGRDMYVVSEINDDGNAEIVTVFLNYRDDWAASGSPEFYKTERPSRDYLDKIDSYDSISEEEYKGLLDEYTKENNSINWIKMEF